MSNRQNRVLKNYTKNICIKIKFKKFLKCSTNIKFLSKVCNKVIFYKVIQYNLKFLKKLRILEYIFFN